MLEKDKQFIPRDKPKSFVIAIIFGLLSLPFGLITLVGIVQSIKLLYYIGFTGGFICAVITTLSIFVFFSKNVTGQYKNITSKSWHEQEW